MKVKDFKGKEYNWKLTGYLPHADDDRPRSEGHLKCRQLLKTMFPTLLILEEVAIPGLSLFFDFYIPQKKLAIEVHGEQHFKYSQHFHGSQSNFRRAKANDRSKIEWCDLNHIDIVILSHKESIDEWRSKITKRTTGLSE